MLYAHEDTLNDHCRASTNTHLHIYVSPALRKPSSYYERLLFHILIARGVEQKTKIRIYARRR